MKLLEIMFLDNWKIYHPTVHNNGQSINEKGIHKLSDKSFKEHWGMELCEIGVGRDNLSILRAVSNALLSRRHRIAEWIK